MAKLTECYSHEVAMRQYSHHVAVCKCLLVTDYPKSVKGSEADGTGELPAPMPFLRTVRGESGPVTELLLFSVQVHRKLE